MMTTNWWTPWWQSWTTRAHTATHFIQEDLYDGDARIRRHYFGANPIYTPKQFRRRFRMNRDTFNRILMGVISVDP
ncbi:hypothetical protein BS78_02G191200 [Paspalum vaginatum]|nr:hypothetical protein BS78_02G191200 [Paspalum vaginatum]